ncbi:hypothetical protein FOL46_006658 [Perkinsus olseni]|uniref:Uncharacterized protein n=1 Tax=Perkinsus olseni TaxID=32597 RepID=A0A7J6MQR9_PEROL|nr:hypothetical protein FOL46_006658 [Perkinsus olseni]
MMVDVGKELLKDANVRVKAEQDGWNIEIDENDVDNVQMALAEVLTIAVATNWNEEVKSLEYNEEEYDDDDDDDDDDDARVRSFSSDS